MNKQLLKIEFKSTVNYFKSLETAKIIVYVFLAFIIAMWLLPILWMVSSSFFIQADNILIAKALFIITIGLIIVHALFLVNGLIKDLFMDSSIKSMLLLPLKPRSLFFVKIFKQYILKVFPISVLLSIIIGFPLYISSGSVIILITNVLYFFTLGIISLSLSYCLVFLVTKITSAKKVGEILTFLGAFLSITPYLFIFMGGQNLRPIIDALPDFSFLYENVLYGDFSIKMLGAIVVCLLILYLLSHLVITAVTNIFTSSQLESTVVKSHGKEKIQVISRTRSLIQKDLHLTFRDFKEWSIVLPHYLFPFLFLFLITSNPAMFGGSSNPDQMILAISLAGSVMISLFVSAMNTARDARDYQFYKVLPIDGKIIIRAKYLFNALTILPVYLVINILMYLFIQASLSSLMYAIIISILVVLTTVPIGMFIGTINPVVSKKNPSNRLDIAGNVMITMTVFIIIFAVGRVSSFFFIGNDINHQVILLTIGVLFITSAISAYIILNRIAKRYDQGYHITYKD